MIQKINEHLPGWLLRVPLAIVFIQQGLVKLPISIEDAQSFDLPYIVQGDKHQELKIHHQ